MQLKEWGQMLKQVLLVSSSNTQGSAGALVSHTGKSQSYAVLPKHVLASPFPAPAHVICSPSSFPRLLLLLKPPKQEKGELSPLHHDTAQAVMLQKLQRSWNNQGCLGLCPLLSPASSCVPWLAGEAASLSPEHRTGCWLLLCTPNKTAGTDRQTHVAGL